MPPTPATHHRLTAAEVEMAFSYCDLQGDGLVTAAGLRARLAPLLLGFTDKKEQAALVETLLGGKPALTLAELTAVLLAPPDGANAKPAAAAKTKIKDLVAEAFALLAGPEEGLFITRGALAQWLLRVDFLQASERDLEYDTVALCLRLVWVGGELCLHAHWANHSSKFPHRTLPIITTQPPRASRRRRRGRENRRRRLLRPPD